MSILTLEIQDEWFYLMGNLGSPFLTSEAFTMQILTPEKRNEWFCFMGDLTACIFRRVVHWNSTWSSFHAIYISNVDLRMQIYTFILVMIQQTNITTRNVRWIGSILWAIVILTFSASFKYFCASCNADLDAKNTRCVALFNGRSWHSFLDEWGIYNADLDARKARWVVLFNGRSYGLYF